MERLIVLRCPTLAREGQEGHELRRFAEVLTTVVRRCPFVQPVRLGLAVLPARAPSRFFGGERAVCELLAEDLADLLADEVSLGIADGLFAAALAARDGLIVPAEGSAEFLAPLSMATLRRPELAATCQRLGVSTLGRFARLDVDRVVERFGRGSRCRFPTGRFRHRYWRFDSWASLTLRHCRLYAEFRFSESLRGHA